MKKFLTASLALVFALAVAAPMALAQSTISGIADADEAGDNLSTGAQNVDWSWTEVMQHSGEEASKGTDAGAHITGAIAGGAIGFRKGLHRLGAGAIDILTFWIPKDEPLIDPSEPTLR